jgi:hypothetical protein
MTHYTPSLNQDLHTILQYENNYMANKTNDLHQLLSSLQKHILYMNNFLISRIGDSGANPNQVSFINITTYDNSGNIMSSVTTDKSGNFVPVVMTDSSGSWIPCVLPPDLSNNYMFTRGIVPGKHDEESRDFPYYPYYPYYGHGLYGPYGPYGPYGHYGPYGPYSADYDYRSVGLPKPHTPIVHPQAVHPQAVHTTVAKQPLGQHIHIYPPGHH